MDIAGYCELIDRIVERRILYRILVFLVVFLYFDFFTVKISQGNLFSAENESIFLSILNIKVDRIINKDGVFFNTKLYVYLYALLSCCFSPYVLKLNMNLVFKLMSRKHDKFMPTIMSIYDKARSIDFEDCRYEYEREKQILNQMQKLIEFLSFSFFITPIALIYCNIVDLLLLIFAYSIIFWMNRRFYHYFVKNFLRLHIFYLASNKMFNAFIRDKKITYGYE